MHWLDWLIVVALNGSIILFAIFYGRDTKTSGDWFLARRSLSWWIVGLSMYATAIDASDLVADTGGAYNFGMSMFPIGGPLRIMLAPMHGIAFAAVGVLQNHKVTRL